MQAIGIIGAGFSGTMVAVHLLRRAMKALPCPETVFLFERAAKFCNGAAYGTTSPQHLLNVPAARMSAFEDDPNHFLRWVRARDSKAIGGSFVPRAIYGDYIASVLRDTHAAAVAQDAPIHFERIASEVVEVAPAGADTSGIGGHGRWLVRTAQGAAFDVDRCLLAIGHYTPRSPFGDSEAAAEAMRLGRIALDPWAPGAMNVERQQDVAIIGTGLTMTDVVMSLEAAGHTGVIWAISRRGLLSQAHRIASTAPKAYPRPKGLDQWPRTAKGLLRALRREVEIGAEQGVDWREVVTSIRHDTQALWMSLPTDEKRRFMRHLGAFWDTHRHRAAPEPAAVIDRLIGEGRLRIVPGRVAGLSLEENGERVAISYHPRGGGSADAQARTIRVSKVINCTGPETDLSRVRDPLVTSLRERGLIRPDVLGLGLESDDLGGVIDARGRVNAGLFVVGPLRKGKLWENTAVPELRGECERMAGVLSTTSAQMPSRVLASRLEQSRRA